MSEGEKILRQRHSGESRGDALLGLTKQGEIVFVNDAFQQLFQYTSDEVLGQPLERLIPVRYRSRSMSEVVNRSRTKILRLRARRKNGTEFSAEVRLEDVKAELRLIFAGALVMATVRNLTDTTELEAQQRQAQKMEALGRLAGGIAHDFNNLLGVILAHTEVALKELRSNGTVRKSLVEIQKAGRTAASLTTQLLIFSRKQAQELRSIDLINAFEEMRGLLPKLLGEDINIEVNLAPDLGKIKADPTQLQRVILNLAANARDAMPTGGKFEIEGANVDFDALNEGSRQAVPNGQYVRLAITDTGQGMNSLTRSHIFEPFFSTKKKGTGLGLATVYGVVTQHKGYIEVASAPMRGTSVSIYLPRVTGADEPPSEPVIQESPMRGNETVLVAEDNTALRKVICKFLKDCGYTVLEAKDGPAAIRKGKVHETAIHLLLTDVVMPKMSGPELAALLKDRHPEMKVIFVSGYADNTMESHGIVQHDTPLLRKPFSLDFMARKVSELLRSAKA
ncbi:MAG: hypothetical protein A3F68_12315 [Acidobacteria bacterium RIFCSPLOWO2_12_FULL_54_10]|nr:MAG: hypothetical protein A3F68_12315 [Acidobacteria bacterium RIFCSPLOWO2_12_FULL_54_10]